MGLVRVAGGEIVYECSMLVQPPRNYYWNSFTQIHGLSAKDTRNAPTFDGVWPEIRRFVEGQHLVAHNAVFDFSCLRSALDFYGRPQPDFSGACTYRLYRHGLVRVCADEGISLDHHDALSDARASAELYLRHLRRSAGVTTEM